MGLYLKIEQKLNKRRNFEKKGFLGKKGGKSDSELFFQNFTVSLVFAQFSNINPFWNHKSISYSYLALNKWRGVKKSSKFTKKSKFVKKWPQNFIFDNFFTNFAPFQGKLCGIYEKIMILWFQNGFIYENWAKTKQTVMFWKKNTEKLGFFMDLGFFRVFFGGG